MLKFARFIFLSTFLGSFNSFGTIPIDLGIEVRGGSFGWNNENDPGAYERIPSMQKAEYFREGFRKAELYCRQALGLKVSIENEKHWITTFQESRRSSLVMHNVLIRCKKALDLDEDDPFIGKYFDHARFILSNFSDSKLPKENHQLEANTLKILIQIGAQAMPLLWDLHRLTIRNGEKSRLLDTMMVIAREDAKAFAQIISLTEQFQSEDEGRWEDLRRLFRECKQEINARWYHIANAINSNIKQMIDEPIFTYSFINNLTTIIYVLDSFHYWMSDSLQKNTLSAYEMCHRKEVIQDWLISVLGKFPELGSIKMFTDLLVLYEMTPPGIQKIND